jgi:hypothetical protein
MNTICDLDDADKAGRGLLVFIPDMTPEMILTCDQTFVTGPKFCNYARGYVPSKDADVPRSTVGWCGLLSMPEIDETRPCTLATLGCSGALEILEMLDRCAEKLNERLVGGVYRRPRKRNNDARLQIQAEMRVVRQRAVGGA